MRVLGSSGGKSVPPTEPSTPGALSLLCVLLGAHSTHQHGAGHGAPNPFLPCRGSTAGAGAGLSQTRGYRGRWVLGIMGSTRNGHGGIGWRGGIHPGAVQGLWASGTSTSFWLRRGKQGLRGSPAGSGHCSRLCSFPAAPGLPGREDRDHPCAIAPPAMPRTGHFPSHSPW